MFKVGDYVVKVNNGVCCVEDITTRNMMGQDKKYYLLVPKDDASAKLYVPIDVEPDKVRYAMTENEAREFLDKIPGIEEATIESEKLREQEYKNAIRSGSPDRLVSIIKNIVQRNKQRLAQGKKNTTIDERYYKQAENLLYSELCFALGMDREALTGMILDIVGR